MIKIFLRLSVAAFTLSLSIATALAGGHSAKLDYNVAGKKFTAHVAMPAQPAKGTIYIIHDWNGLDAYEIGRAEMLAEQGYTAIAIDLFGVDAKLEGRDDYRRETGALYKDRDTFRARIKAAIAAGQTKAGMDGKAFIMGYCFGGAGVLEAARAGMALDGFISFHGGLSTPDGQNYSHTKGSVLLLHGSADPVSGMQDLASLLDELQAANIPHAAEIFGGARHSFTVAGSRDYDATADAGSWDALMRYLDQNS